MDRNRTRTFRIQGEHSTIKPPGLWQRAKGSRDLYIRAGSPLITSLCWGASMTKQSLPLGRCHAQLSFPRPRPLSRGGGEDEVEVEVGRTRWRWKWGGQGGGGEGEMARVEVGRGSWRWMWGGGGALDSEGAV